MAMVSSFISFDWKRSRCSQAGIEVALSIRYLRSDTVDVASTVRGKQEGQNGGKCPRPAVTRRRIAAGAEGGSSADMT